MAYVKTNWQDGVEGNTKIDATKLNNIENGIETNDTTITNFTDFNNSLLLFDTTKRINFNPTSGSNASVFGGCYYYKIGTKVHVHIGIQGITANTNTDIYTLPAGYIPDSFVATASIGGSLVQTSSLTIDSSGKITIRTTGTYALVDIEYDAVA